MKKYPRLHVAALFIIAFLTAILSGCHRQTDNEYEQQIKQIHNQVKKGAGREVLATLDSIKNNDPDNWYLKMSVYQVKKDYYYRKEIFDTNNLYVDSILFAIEHSGLKEKYPADYAEALNNMGNRFFEITNYKKAFEYYYKARVAAVLTGDSCLLGDQSYHLGMVCYRQEKFGEAILHFSEAMMENEKCGPQNMVYYRKEELINNIALAYTHLYQYDSALQYYSKLLVYINTGREGMSNQPHLEKFAEVATAVAYGNISDIMIAEHRYDTAKALLIKSIATNIRPEYDNRDALYSQIKLAQVYDAMGEDAMMLATLNAMRRPMDSIKDNIIAQRWTRLMYVYKKKENDLKGAVANIDSYLQLRDTADSKSKELKQTDYVQLLQDQEKEYQMDILRKRNQVSRAYLIAATSLIGIGIVLVMVILVNYRRTRQNMAVLTRLNDKVNEQNKQLASTMADLRQSNLDKDRILHVVAHDLRSPVGAITMMAALIKDSDDEAERNNLLELISSSCQSQLALISELMEFNEKDKGDHEPAEKFDVSDIARQSVSLLRFKAGEKEQDITIHTPIQSIPVNARKEKINRVFNNLITNAIKFSPRGGVIDVSVYADGGKVVAAVKDRGLGIPQKNRDKVFDAFTTAKRTGTAGEKSFGLGLSICRQIVEADGGTIWFDSEEGKGSTFYVELPLA